MNGVPGRVLLAVFLRSFLIQGSWNYRTMIGGGFAFAILPALRWIYRDDPDALGLATGRHTEHFNAHPYMAGLALGSTVRLETDGAPDDAVRRFKSAVRGPLGGLGDRLVWVGWLPLTLLTGLILAVVGLQPGWVVVAFLALYNVGHLAFRWWAFRTGLRVGPGVAGSLKGVRLADKTDKTQEVGALLLGVLAGLVAVRMITGGDLGPVVALCAAVSFVVGARLGARVWRPMAVGLMVLILVLTLAGTFR